MGARRHGRSPRLQLRSGRPAVETQTPVSQPPSRTAAEPSPDLPAAVVSAGEFPGSIRIPGTESAFKLGGQARLVAVHTLSALGTEDRFVTSSIPVGVPRAGEDARTVYSPTASRLSTELRMPSPRGPDAYVHRERLRGRRPGDETAARVPPDERFVVGQTWSTFSDPEADPIGIDFEGLNAISLFRQPQFRWTPSSASHATSGQWPSKIQRPLSRVLRASTTRPTWSRACD